MRNSLERKIKFGIEASIRTGGKVSFASEKQPYTVKAYDGRYAICTKPYNPQRTVIYTILDLKQGIRSTNWLVFNSYDYTIQADIDKCLKDLQSGTIELSRRNQIPLDLIN